MNKELESALNHVESRLLSLLSEVREIRTQMISPSGNQANGGNHGQQFFMALTAEDRVQSQSKYMQCPHN